MKKIRPTHKYTYIAFAILFLALLFLLWAICGTRWWNYQGDYVKEKLWVDLTYTFISFAICFIGAIIYRFKVYYLVDNKKIIRHSNKVEEYHFNDIVYIDEDYSKKHKSEMRIYINLGRWVTLTLDKNKEIYDVIKKNSKLLSEEDFIFKYPKAINDNKINKR